MYFVNQYYIVLISISGSQSNYIMSRERFIIFICDIDPSFIHDAFIVDFLTEHQSYYIFIYLEIDIYLYMI